MTDARVVAVYGGPSRLPSPTGPDVQRHMASLKVRLIARYRLHTVPGRPEELVQAIRPEMAHLPADATGKPTNTTVQWVPEGRTVSLGYGCKTIRIRKHGGPNNRNWVDVLDIHVRDGWHAEVYAYLDEFFGFVSPAILA